MSERIARRPLLAAAAALAIQPESHKQRRNNRARWSAGLAQVEITPARSMWMAGYALRTRPSEGTLTPLHAKALALDDGSGLPAVLVTADLLGFPAALAQRIARRARRMGVSRDRLVLSASHTHGGPVVGDTLRVAYPMTQAQWADVRAYTRWLEDQVAECILRALRTMAPAILRFGRTRAGFAANRRADLHPGGPVDQEVPFLHVRAPDGAARAFVFSYACHNTTLGSDEYHFHGDYAGFAQAALQAAHPGAQAMFLSGCGADANPSLRGKREHARHHGEELAAGVLRALPSSRPVNGPLRAAYSCASLAFQPAPGSREWRHKLSDSNVYVRRHAALMLEQIAREGTLPESYPCPVQVWRFGDSLTFVALGGEVVVDYALRLKRELAADKLWVTAYCNDVFAYIPSERVLLEGGYEGGGAMLYYGQPGPFAPGVEETLVAEVRRCVDAAASMPRDKWPRDEWLGG